ncbi:hypothetical protein CRUP_006701 [Coryphaenoides rupestris]|nr:hypothetical protein CRUP_006701 [Coryphaenoides rupestris]
MLEGMSRRSRSLLSLSLTTLALVLSILALCTSYWCEGTHKVVKPLCLSPVKMKDCESPTQSPFTRTMSPVRRDELARIRQRQLANAVHYIWETGEDKYAFRYFHTGFWESCERHSDGETPGEKCRSFIELTPGETQGVLWLSVISEFAYIGLLGLGFLLLWLELLCSHKEMHALKINAYAAICTMTVIVGPKDWRPQTWDYGWSFA